MMLRRRTVGLLVLAAIAAWNLPLLAGAAQAEPWREWTSANEARLPRGVRSSWMLGALESQAGVPWSGTVPRVRSVDAFPGGFVITDSERQKIVEWTPSKVTAWATPGRSWYAQRLSNGDFLLALRDDLKVVELSRDGGSTLVYGTGESTHDGLGVMDPFGVERLNDAPDGRLLIAESVRGPRVAEVDPARGVVWEAPGGIAKAKSAHWLHDGAEVIVADEQLKEVRIYDRATSRVVWSFGAADVAGLQEKRYDPASAAAATGPDGREHVYIADDYDLSGPGGRVLDVDRATKTVLNEFGAQDGSAEDVTNPRGIDVGPDGTVYVADDFGKGGEGRVLAYGYQASGETPVASVGSDFDDKQVRSITWQASLPEGTSVEMLYSLDGGASWASAGTSGSFTFPSGTHGRVRYKARLATTDARTTPVLTGVTVRWLPLGVAPAPETSGGGETSGTPAGSGTSGGSETATGSQAGGSTRVRVRLGTAGGAGNGGTGGPGAAGTGGAGQGGIGAGAGSGSRTGLLFERVDEKQTSQSADASEPPRGATRAGVSILGTLYGLGLLLRPRPWLVPI